MRTRARVVEQLSLACPDMTHGPSVDTWPQRQNLVIAQQVVRYRRARGLTADQLAQKVSNLGLPFSQNKVANIESARRNPSGVPVAVLVALAAALEVSPLQLLLPIGETDDQVEILPGCHVDAWTAARWFDGSTPLGTETDQWKSGVAPLVRRRAHDQLLDQWERARRNARVEHLAAREETDEYEREMRTSRWRAHEEIAETALRNLALVRHQMTSSGQPLPEIPDALRARLENTSTGGAE